MNLDNQEAKNGFNPPVRITESNRYINIIVGLQDILEEQIRIDLEKTILTVTVSTIGDMRRKVIHVPEGARFFTKRFSAGVLEICLEKTVS